MSSIGPFVALPRFCLQHRQRYRQLAFHFLSLYRSSSPTCPRPPFCPYPFPSCSVRGHSPSSSSSSASKVICSFRLSSSPHQTCQTADKSCSFRQKAPSSSHLFNRPPRRAVPPSVPAPAKRQVRQEGPHTSLLIPYKAERLSSQPASNQLFVCKTSVNEAKFLHRPSCNSNCKGIKHPLGQDDRPLLHLPPIKLKALCPLPLVVISL